MCKQIAKEKDQQREPSDPVTQAITRSRRVSRSRTWEARTQIHQQQLMSRAGTVRMTESAPLVGSGTRTQAGQGPLTGYSVTPVSNG